MKEVESKLKNVFGSIDKFEWEPTPEGRFVKVTLKVRGVTLTQYWCKDQPQTRVLIDKMVDYLL